MEEKDLNEMLLDNSRQNQKTKNIILGIISVVVILIVILLIWSFTHTGPKEESEMANHSHETNMPMQETSDLNFADNNSDQTNINPEIDSFDQVVNNIKDAELKHNADAKEMHDTFPDAHHNHQATSADSITTTSDAKKDVKQNAQTKASPIEKIAKADKKILKKFDNITLEEAEKGSYLQVGVFANKPNKTMQKILENHSFKILTMEINDQKVTKYLIGPFKSRIQASNYKQANPELKDSVYFEVK